MSTIVSALQSATMSSSTTSQLVLTRESSLSKSEKQILRYLEELLNPQGDHQAYREALKNIKTPFAVPWLGTPHPSFLFLSLSYHHHMYTGISGPPTQHKGIL